MCASDWGLTSRITYLLYKVTNAVHCYNALPECYSNGNQPGPAEKYPKQLQAVLKGLVPSVKNFKWFSLTTKVAVLMNLLYNSQTVNKVFNYTLVSPFQYFFIFQR